MTVVAESQDAATKHAEDQLEFDWKKVAERPGLELGPVEN